MFKGKDDAGKGDENNGGPEAFSYRLMKQEEGNEGSCRNFKIVQQ